MNRTTVVLNEISTIKKFNNEVEKFESDIDLIKGRYVIDAKSLIGLFTLDLSTPVDIVIHSENEDEIKRFYEAMKEFN